MKQILKHLPMDAFIIGTCFYGFFMGSTIAYNLGIFMLWTIIIIGLFVLWSDDVKAAAKKSLTPRTPVFKVWDVGTDLIIIALPVAAGMWVTGALLLLLFVSFSKWELEREVDKENSDGTRKEEPQV